MFRLPRSAGDDRSPYGRFWFEPVGGRSSSGVRVTSDSAMRLAAVYACVVLLSKTKAMLPFTLGRPKPGGGSVPQTDHWLYKLIARRPNQFQDPFMWRQMCMGHFALRGNVYNRIYANRKGEVTDLIPQHPDRVKIEQFPTGDYRYRIKQLDGTDLILPRGQMWHLRGLSADGVVGLSPLALARDAIGRGLAAQEYGAQYFGNNGAPTGGWIELPGKFKTKADRDAFTESWQNARTGEGRHKTPVLDDGMKYHELGIKNDEAQFIDTMQFSVTDICRFFGVPPHMVADLTQCMPADTLIFTSTGPRRIADVLPGDQVWSPTPTGPKLAKVLNNWANGIDEILEIRTTNRTVRCNAKHRLLVRRRCERPLNPGEVGGKNIDGRKVRIHWRNEYVPAGDLEVGDTLIALDRLPASGETEAPNGRTLTVGFMESCGLLLADGNLFYRNGKPAGFSISRGDNAGYMGHYRDVICSEFERYDGGNWRGDLIGIARERSRVTPVEAVRRTNFTSILAGSELSDLGFAGTAFTKRVPGWVFGLTEELRLGALRGFLDGDGTVDRKGRITFYSASKALLDDIRHLCMSAGVPVTNMRSDLNGKNGFLPKTGIPTRMWRFTCSDPGENSRIGSHDPRYIERFKQGKPFHRKDRNYPLFGGKEFSLNGFELSRIVAIEHKLAEPVFDIEVEGTHCFIADGIGSHNSTNNNIEQQSLEYRLFTMAPICAGWKASIKSEFIEDDDDLEPGFDLDELTRADSTARSNFNKSMFNIGAYSPNDILATEGKDPFPGGEQRFIPVNMTVLTPNMQPSTASQGSADANASDGEGESPSAPAPKPKPAPKKKNGAMGSDRAVLLASAAAERIARRELAVVTKAAKVVMDNPGALETAFEAHAHFIAEALAIDIEKATDYCADRRASLDGVRPDTDLTDYEIVSRCLLERLALEGEA